MSWFALATVEIGGRARPGMLLGDGSLTAPEELASTTVRALLGDWEAAQSVLAGLAADPGPPLPADTTVLTPVRYPDSLLAVGANYASHLREMRLAVERWATMPYFHRPPRTCLVGPGDTVRIPDSTTRFDWECELAVVLGRPLRHASRDQARAAVAGDLRITLSVSDQPMMDASTREMLYPVDELLAEISRYTTLVPGDIVFTGSPAGSAGDHGGRWLLPGDRIDATITGIPTLTVTMRETP